MTRRLVLAAAFAVALAACGKYGPPVRTHDVPAPAAAPAAAPATAPPASGSPASSDAEQCDDPNAPKAEAKP